MCVCTRVHACMCVAGRTRALMFCQRPGNSINAIMQRPQCIGYFFQRPGTSVSVICSDLSIWGGGGGDFFSSPSDSALQRKRQRPQLGTAVRPTEKFQKQGQRTWKTAKVQRFADGLRGVKQPSVQIISNSGPEEKCFRAEKFMPAFFEHFELLLRALCR